MWREFIQGLTTELDLAQPASPMEIDQAEQRLGVRLPDDLRGLLQETNGASFGMNLPGEDKMCHFCLIWSTEEMLEQNLNLREFDENFPEQFEPLTPLLFFASLPNGDPVAFRMTDGQVSSPTVVSMSHEAFGECREVSASLGDYLRLLLSVEAEAEPGAV